MEKRDYGIFGSSEDPQRIGDTVKALIIGLASLIIIVARQFDVPLTETQVAEIASTIGLAISTIGVLYGLLKKAFVRSLK